MGVTDLKAAMRFLGYNSALIPFDLDCFYSFRHTGGWSQSFLMEVTGKSELFDAYLNDIGSAVEDADGNEIWITLKALNVGVLFLI